MDKREHAFIDIEKLADSLRGQFKTIQPLSENCCIYRIPQRIRQLNQSACSPRAVSIGPFHHGREELQPMEECKIRYLRNFLERTEVRIEDFLLYIKDREVELLECYAESINLRSEKFVKMVLVDAAFLIELFLSMRYNIPFLRGKCAQPSLSMGIDIWPDIWKLENQLPMFILEGLFELAISGMSSKHYGGLSMWKLAHSWFSGQCEILMIEEGLFEILFSKAKHLLDLLRICFQPPDSGAQSELKTLVTPTVTELQQAGVKFKLGSSKHLFDIRFRNGILEIPKLKIDNGTEGLFLNLLSFEQLHCNTNHSNDYIVIINHLVNNIKDEEILIQNGVIENFLWKRERGTALFHNLSNQSNVCPKNFYYSDLAEKLNAYCRTPWYKWKATLKQNYFNTPWAFISVTAAVILLILTFISSLFYHCFVGFYYFICMLCKDFTYLVSSMREEKA